MKRKNGYLYAVFAVLLSLAVIGRILTALYNYTYNDITFPDWVPSALSYASDIVTGMRMGVSIGALCFAVYYNAPGSLKTALLAGAASFVDCALRFVIDLFNDALGGSELLAVMWLSLQLLFELLFITVTNLVASKMHTKLSTAETSAMRAKYSAERAALVSVAVYAAANVAIGLVDIIDFITEYSDITNAEIASMTGTVIRILVISGGIVYIFADITLSLLAGKVRVGSHNDTVSK